MESRAPDRTLDEFHTLLAHPHLQREEFVSLLPGRTEGAIDVVREGICDFHERRPNALLSQLMVDALSQIHGHRTCAVCRKAFDKNSGPTRA